MDSVKISPNKSIHTLNCKGKLLTLDVPVVMGIINVTPDSFYEDSRITSAEEYVEKAGKMLLEGARILDIGGQSTRPGSTRLDVQEEVDRVLPVITSILRSFPDSLLSIDTYHHRVAEIAVEAGVAIVNDISSGNLDPQMLPTVAKLGVPYIAMHMKGSPEYMQELADYDNILKETIDYFTRVIADCRKLGIRDIILDPGFGFAKTPAQSLALLKQLEQFHIFGNPILVGMSRKSMIYKSLGVNPSDALNGTTVLNTLALYKGANILRVHDVREAVEAIKLVNAVRNT